MTFIAIVIIVFKLVLHFRWSLEVHTVLKHWFPFSLPSLSLLLMSISLSHPRTVVTGQGKAQTGLYKFYRLDTLDSLLKAQPSLPGLYWQTLCI